MELAGGALRFETVVRGVAFKVASRGGALATSVLLVAALVSASELLWLGEGLEGVAAMVGSIDRGARLLQLSCCYCSCVDTYATIVNSSN
jgi:hypothetical protein